MKNANTTENKVRVMNCPKCGRFMHVTIRRDDGCRMFTCFKCGIDVGEETEEWFRKMEKVDITEESK